MERVTFLVEDTHERITALLNPAGVISRRNAVVRDRRSLPVGQSGGFFDHGPVVTGGSITEIELDLLFDTSLAGSSITTDDVRLLTEPLWRLAEARADSAASILQLPQLRLIWGKAWNVPAVVVALAERLEHFDADGAARRSWLRLRLRRVPERAAPSPPGVLPGMPAKRSFPAGDTLVQATKALPAGTAIALTKSDAPPETEIADLVTNVLDKPAAKECVEDASMALDSAKDVFVTSGLALSVDVSISTSVFSFEMSLSLDLSALSPKAIATRVAGWLKWARDGLSSLGAAAARVGLSAVRNVKAGLDLVVERLETLAQQAAAELRPIVAKIKAGLAVAAQRVADLARFVVAEVRQRVVDGYHAVAFATQRAARWIGQHVDAVVRATGRLAANVGDAIRKTAGVFLDATTAVAGVIARTALDAYRLAGQSIRSGAKKLVTVAGDIASSVRTTLANAYQAARRAADALLDHLRQVAPEVLRWAKDAIVRSVTTLGDAAFAAAAGLQRAGRFVLETTASALSRAIAQTRAFLASVDLHVDVHFSWQLTELMQSDDIASNDQATQLIRARVGLIMPKLTAFERDAKSVDRSALDKELEKLAALVFPEEAAFFDRMVETLDRPVPRSPKGTIRLDLLALEQCGDPRGWKQIAEANDIDDPLAVPEGTALDLSSLSFQGSP